MSPEDLREAASGYRRIGEMYREQAEHDPYLSDTDRAWRIDAASVYEAKAREMEMAN